MATSIWGLPQPAGTDLASTVDDSIKALSDALDNATQNVTMLRKGVYASIPSAATAKSGCYYLATDTGVLWLSDGTNWVKVNDNTDPIGTIKGFAADADPSDTRYVRCDGRAISRSTYSALFTLVSTAYGVGDGSTTFNIPDLRGRTLVAVDGAAARLTANDSLGQSAGAEKHTLVTGELPAGVPWTTGSTITFWSLNSGTASGRWAPTTDASLANWNPGGNGAHNNMQPYLVAQYIIRIG